MEASPNLKLVAVDTDTGEAHHGCPRCRDVALEDVENLERKVRKLERQIRQHQRDLDAQRQIDPQRNEIIEIVERWKAATSHTRSLVSADRFDLTKARLREGFTVETLELAVDGIAAYAYVVNGQRVPHGTPPQRHDGLSIAFKGGENVERFANLGYQARKAAA